MKKIKAIFLLITMTLVCAIFATACSGGDVSVVLDKESVTLDVGQSITINADVDGTKDSVAWSSANEDVVTVTQDGTVTGVKNGETKVYAEAGGEKAECIISVQEGVLGKPKIKLNCGAVNLYRGYKYEISASFYIGAQEQSVNGNDFVWTSDNEAVATVVSGTITAISVGKATIKVSYSYNGETYFDQKEISVNPLAMLLVEAEESTLASSVTYGGKTNSNLTETNLSITKVDGETVTTITDFSNVTFTSSDSDVATVNAAGIVKAGGKIGNATVTVKITDSGVDFIGTCDFEVKTSISTKHDMDMLALAYARGKVDDWAEGNYYLLTNNIDYSGAVYIPIAAYPNQNLNSQNNFIGLQWKTVLGADNAYGITYDQFKTTGLNQFNWHTNRRTDADKYRFNAVFDGNGFTVSNGKMMFDAMGFDCNDGVGFSTGLFGSIGEKGVLKNVSFINFSRQTYQEAGYSVTKFTNNKSDNKFALDWVTTTSATIETGSGNYGIYPQRINGASLICNVYGTVENIYVKATYTPGGSFENFTASGIAAYIAFSSQGKNAVLKNCYFDITGTPLSGSIYAYRLYGGSSVTIENVMVVGLKKSDGSSAIDSEGIAGIESSVPKSGTIGNFEDYTVLKNAISSGSVEIGSDWKIDETSGLPVLNIR